MEDETPICPECGGNDWRNRGSDGEYFPVCEDCGYVEYTEETLQLMEETRREFEQAKAVCYPDPVPSYAEWINQRKMR